MTLRPLGERSPEDSGLARRERPEAEGDGGRGPGPADQRGREERRPRIQGLSPLHHRAQDQSGGGDRAGAAAPRPLAIQAQRPTPPAEAQELLEVARDLQIVFPKLQVGGERAGALARLLARAKAWWEGREKAGVVHQAYLLPR